MGRKMSLTCDDNEGVGAGKVLEHLITIDGLVMIMSQLPSEVVQKYY